ncbi:hypothetical protein TruAng_002197 [Truncatella angustata]|nr:hypothetical protein TruAng_002197 [Truncatella angustata]
MFANYAKFEDKLKSDNDAFITLFYAGLREDIKDKVAKEDRPEEFDDYVERIVKIDNRLYKKRLEKRGSGNGNRDNY